MSSLEMRPGDLIFVRGKGLVVKPIKLVTRSKYSHVCGYVKKDLFIGVQDFRKTRYEVLKRYEGVSDVYTCDILTSWQRAMIVTYAKSELGSRYDYLLLGWEAVRYLFGITLPYSRNGKRICSTLWADAYRTAGVDLCPGVKYPSPADLIKSPLLRHIGSF